MKNQLSFLAAFLVALLCYSLNAGPKPDGRFRLRRQVTGNSK
ncbi:MAG: hypothetical protein ACOXZV_11795 [Bacteroidales bacterium]